MVLIADGCFGVVQCAAFVVKGEKHEFFAVFIVNLDEAEIIHRKILFHYMPGENLEGVVGSGQYREILHRIPSELEGVGHL